MFSTRLMVALIILFNSIMTQEFIESIEQISQILPINRSLWDGDYDPVSQKIWTFGGETSFA